MVSWFGKNISNLFFTIQTQFSPVRAGGLRDQGWVFTFWQSACTQNFIVSAEVSSLFENKRISNLISSCLRGLYLLGNCTFGVKKLILRLKICF